MFGNIKVFAGTASPALAQEIAGYLNVPLSGRDIIKFPNENIFVKLHASVRGQDCYVVQTTSAPTSDNLLELLIMVQTLRLDSAGRITVVVPYLAYARSDKKDQPRVPITARLVADMIQVAGADRYILMDLHAGQIQGFFHIPVDDITARHHLADWVKRSDITNGVVLSPDLGHAKDARYFADEVDMPLALVEKRRSKDGGNTEALNLIGEVDGKDVLIVDEEIDTAGTMVHAAEFAIQRGAKRVYALATHAILSPPAIERLRSSPFERVVVTNSCYLPPEKQLPCIEVLPIGALLGEVIHRIHTGQSVGAMFNE